MNFINSIIGLLHTVSALLAMVFGAVVVFGKKGTRKHKLNGYIYVANMLFVNFSAFAIYNFGGFSMFHFFALVSLVTIVFGMRPVLRKNKGWLIRHFSLMSWSVVGLYCAFWAEIGTRFFEMKFFWWVVVIATISTSVIGGRIINRQRKKLLSRKRDNINSMTEY